jgi:hypothetical protein
LYSLLKYLESNKISFYKSVIVYLENEEFFEKYIKVLNVEDSLRSFFIRKQIKKCFNTDITLLLYSFFKHL